MSELVETQVTPLKSNNNLPPEVTPTSQMNQFMGALERIATNPQTGGEKLKDIMDAQERILDKQAEMSFNADMARLQPEMPMIKKKASGHNTKYARYEDIERQVRPHYTKYGFSLTYTSRIEGNNEIYTGTLRHREGHHELASIVLPADASGGKNAIQAKGSSMSYAKRYLLTMLLNIVMCDEDDDGHYAGDVIDQAIVDDIKNRIKALPDSEEYAPKFLKFVKAESIEEIHKSELKKALNALKAKEVQSNENS